MAGSDAQLPVFEVVGPTWAPANGTWSLSCVFKRGVMKLNKL